MTYNCVDIVVIIEIVEIETTFEIIVEIVVQIVEIVINFFLIIIFLISLFFLAIHPPCQVNAMEVSGIEGNYRLTCEKVREQ